MVCFPPVLVCQSDREPRRRWICGDWENVSAPFLPSNRRGVSSWHVPEARFIAE
jgi:hypothetical protein